MKINVGSQNKTKITAVERAAQLYPNLFPNAQVLGVKTSAPLYGHPKNLSETIQGALDRAREAFIDCDFSFGLEGGLVEVLLPKPCFMEVGACVVFDGKNVALGFSPMFEWPEEVTKLIIAGQADASQAFKLFGYTTHEKLGSEEGGIIGFLTHGRLTREEFTLQSIITALIKFERSEFYHLTPTA